MNAIMRPRECASPVLEALSANLIFERARAGLSQGRLAERSGVSRPTISRIERAVAADVGLDTLQKLADALGTTVRDLFTPIHTGPVDPAELARRAAVGDEEYVDARALLDAVEEAAGRPRRYSRVGRPPVDR
jgi:transcriptional regulator with XRE-family HTH domain